MSLLAIWMMNYQIGIQLYKENFEQWLTKNVFTDINWNRE